MFSIDIPKNLKKELLSDINKGKKINSEKLKDICKRGCGEDTCKYIILTSNGFFCAKKTSFKDVLDKSSDNGFLLAKGDNCEGL